MKDIFDALFCDVETRAKLIVTLQRRLILKIHPCHHGIHPLPVHLSKAQSPLFEEEVPRMFSIMQVVGIVHYSLNVTFVITHLHDSFKNIVHYLQDVMISIYLDTSPSTALFR